MKRFINGIEEHRWTDFCQDMIERRDGKKYPKDCNYGPHLSDYGEFYNVYGVKKSGIVSCINIVKFSDGTVKKIIKK